MHQDTKSTRLIVVYKRTFISILLPWYVYNMHQDTKSTRYTFISILCYLFPAFLAALFVDKGVEPVKLFCKVCLFPRLRVSCLL